MTEYCRYSSKICLRPRLINPDGTLHRLCDIHHKMYLKTADRYRNNRKLETQQRKQASTAHDIMVKKVLESQPNLISKYVDSIPNVIVPLAAREKNGGNCYIANCQATIQTGGRVCIFHRPEPTCREPLCLRRAIRIRNDRNGKKRKKLNKYYCSVHQKLEHRMFCCESGCFNERIKNSETCWLHGILNTD